MSPYNKIFERFRISRNRDIRKLNFAILTTKSIKNKMNKMNSVITTYRAFASIVAISIISLIIGICLFIMNSDPKQIIFTAFVTYIATYLWSFNLIKNGNANDIIKSRRSIIDFDMSKSVPRYIGDGEPNWSISSSAASISSKM